MQEHPSASGRQAGPGTGAPPPSDGGPPDGPQPGDLRFLRWLVGALAGVMIVGLITIVALLAIRLQSPAPPPLDLPAALALPEGVRALAFTQGADWIAVVTEDDEILIFDRSGTRLRQRIAILPEGG